jgi:hypothetical protein
VFSDPFFIFVFQVQDILTNPIILLCVNLDLGQDLQKSKKRREKETKVHFLVKYIFVKEESYKVLDTDCIIIFVCEKWETISSIIFCS